MTDSPSAGSAASNAPREEVSAGGIVMGPDGLLMIKVKNLEGSVLWTFPKGHVEAGETPTDAALREVLEETGWKCRVIGRLGEVRYKFKRDFRWTHKVVHWFYMAPETRLGRSDPDEVLDCRWYSLSEAAGLVEYKSDKSILAMLKKKTEASRT